MTLKDNFVLSFCNRRILDLPAPRRDVPLCLSARMGLYPMSHRPFGKGSAQQWGLIGHGEGNSGNMEVSRAEAGVDMSPAPSSHVVRHFRASPGRTGRLCIAKTLPDGQKDPASKDNRGKSGI